MKLRLALNGTAITAKVIDSATTRDFISLLPLTLSMNDLFAREKFGQLPRALSTQSKHAHTFALGEIAYWPPGPDLAIFYRHDGESIPDPGIIVIGKVVAHLEALEIAGPVSVTVEVVE